MRRPLQPISLAGSHLAEVRHICAFFTNDEEEYCVSLPFVREGLSCGDKSVKLINPDARQQYLRRPAETGIDSTAHRQSGQLQIWINTEVYLRDGHFDQPRMLAAFEEMAASARSAEGFPMTHIVCRMDWASGDHSRIDDLIEFESRVNKVWHRYDDTVICTYYLGQLSRNAVVDIMRTHPIVFIGGHLRQNPFFTRPEEFFDEFRGRRAGRTNPQ
jgi:hypothetical protein